MRIKELHQLLTENNLWKIRLYKTGIIKKGFCIFHGITGILSRSILIYLNIIQLYYDYYYFIHFVFFYSIIGDCLDRYILRINEILESCHILYIITYVIIIITFIFYLIDSIIIMELLINEFVSNLYCSILLLSLLLIISIESSKGIYSVFISWFLELYNIITNDILILNEINLFYKYYLIGDLIVVLGSIDFVLIILLSFFFLYYYGIVFLIQINLFCWCLEYYAIICLLLLCYDYLLLFNYSIICFTVLYFISSFINITLYYNYTIIN
ncbi:MAG: hypothetical protein GY941_28620 [Planctomycetes bacterium]|nr:hypothetical protein [Planctomycetota bacterium]